MSGKLQRLIQWSGHLVWSCEEIMLHWFAWLVALPVVGAMTLCMVACIELGATSPPTPRFAVPIIFTISAAPSLERLLM